MARFVVPAVRDDDRSWTEVGDRRATRALSFWGTTSATAMIAGNQQAIICPVVLLSCPLKAF